MKQMRFFVLAALVLSFSACSIPSSKRDQASVELFNGRNLEGWQHVLAEPAVARDAVWSVRNGMIVCRGEPLGVLHTTGSYTNFRLLLEYRWAPDSKPGNSGILTRINGPTRALPRCAEVQLQHGNAGDILGLQGMRVAEGQPRFFAVQAHKLAGDIAGVRKIVDAEKPGGEWNRVEVIAQGGNYTVWMNGQMINEARGVEVLPGPIGLQSEGGEIHFRRVTLTWLAE